ncbi:AraC family transcriptional regulator [Acidovorax sp. Leaf76]|uniref:AraC family transcriptional regulator n=1 Tax=unclassified Acidovorax TaxID=2684926 RepID=UPI0006F74934|nr:MULTISPECIES: AraC family transcriptional regulator [unclassified Acidovorax]KQO20745.1 AraC family transcriptional regulator [Acidovorax sp. Leaf76]KQO34008.1 AraC family transcriptional regulator [Acidovorax sp. Leaf84]KQS36628.1 AraC family transcriptional regulator [Acidovorax sp. Leaf191]
MDSTAAPSLSLRSYGASPGSHSHGHFQVLMGLSGALELEVEGRGLRVAPGSGYVIEPGARHDFESRHGSVCLVLDSPDHAWSQCAKPPAPALALAHYLASALQQGLPMAQAHGPALLLEAWRALPAPAAAHSGTAGPASRRRAIDWAQLQGWAAQQGDAHITVADLAARVHLSASQFAARCRDDLGISAMAWLRGQRLAQARLLRDSGMAVAEVARRTGYRSPSALTAALRRAGP